ncbi:MULTISPECIES: hypothetical protein [unclassified Caballeronia]|jgi:hypothetical protein|uniref:hypothetical protein n=1 Tax=unclassified Caballeronia TaxID=2646786 RepID=UPI0028546A78|nr:MULTISPECIES: hypothetical protein [unclassified Caballeronia]MDR5753337.1 hypothetical protein [Caballeronia sp. LZ024]MDR5841076.1 hypothetical protein [Caballeronia sp. LZ031]
MFEGDAVRNAVKTAAWAPGSTFRATARKLTVNFGQTLMARPFILPSARQLSMFDRIHIRKS